MDRNFMGRAMCKNGVRTRNDRLKTIYAYNL